MGERQDTGTIRQRRDLRALRRKKAQFKFNDEVKEKRVYTFPKILVTATVAITMAVISSFLTTAVNSFLLVLLVSIITGILSEVYRVILAFVKYGAMSVTDIPTKKSRAELKQEKLAREIRALEHQLGVPPTESLELPEDLEALARIEVEEQKATESETRTITRPIDSLSPEEIVKTRVLNVIAGREPEEFAPVEQEITERKKWWQHVISFLKIRPQFNMVLIFFFVAVIAVIGSFFVNQHFMPEVNQTNITEQKVTKTVKLSEKDRQAMIDEAVQEALSKIPAVPEEQVTSDDINALWSQLNEVSEKLNTLIESENARDDREESNPSTPSEPGLTSDDLTPLQNEIEDIQSRITELENVQSESDNSGITTNQ